MTGIYIHTWEVDALGCLNNCLPPPKPTETYRDQEVSLVGMHMDFKADRKPRRPECPKQFVDELRTQPAKEEHLVSQTSGDGGQDEQAHKHLAPPSQVKPGIGHSGEVIRTQTGPFSPKPVKPCESSENDISISSED